MADMAQSPSPAEAQGHVFIIWEGLGRGIALPPRRGWSPHSGTRPPTLLGADAASDCLPVILSVGVPPKPGQDRLDASGESSWLTDISRDSMARTPEAPRLSAL
jgi:hypothetical protein